MTPLTPEQEAIVTGAEVGIWRRYQDDGYNSDSVRQGISRAIARAVEHERTVNAQVLEVAQARIDRLNNVFEKVALLVDMDEGHGFPEGLIEATEQKLDNRTEDTEAKLARLEQWKKEQMIVSANTHYHEVGEELGVGLGEDIAIQILPGIRKLKAERDHWKRMCEKDGVPEDRVPE